jgi:hypothetical protein
MIKLYSKVINGKRQGNCDKCNKVTIWNFQPDQELGSWHCDICGEETFEGN